MRLELTWGRALSAYPGGTSTGTVVRLRHGIELPITIASSELNGQACYLCFAREPESEQKDSRAQDRSTLALAERLGGLGEESTTDMIAKSNMTHSTSSRTMSRPQVRRRANMGTALLAIVVPALSLSGCDSYWWTRGQPPATGELVQRATAAFDDHLQNAEKSRPDLVSAAKDARGALLALAQAVRTASANGKAAVDPAAIEAVNQKLVPIEHSLSIGSRPAFAELSGQIRHLSQQANEGQALSAPAVETVVSRTLFLLANELTGPPPTFL